MALRLTPNSTQEEALSAGRYHLVITPSIRVRKTDENVDYTEDDQHRNKQLFLLWLAII